MGLTSYGMREWLSATVVCGGLATASSWARWWWAVAVVLAAWAGILWFFRDPPRRPATDPGPEALLSPADGRVTAVEQVEHHPVLGGPATVVRIFLSVLNVHVNRSPAGGRVVSVEHRPGRFHDARSPRSSAENESSLLTLRCDDGRTIAVRQIAGRIARRIVCAAAPGDHLERGERFGMIKFGSSTELIMPTRPGLAVAVRPGERVRGGRTVIAE
jgi:phosphatidylserine decarboxylase